MDLVSEFAPSLSASHCLEHRVRNIETFLDVFLEGKGTLCVNGVEQKLHFGQMFMTKPGENTWYKADSEDPWAYCWMAFDGNIARDCAEKAGFFDGVNCLDCHVDQQNFYSLVQRTLNHVELTTASAFYRSGLPLEFIGMAIESYTDSEGKTHKSSDYQTDSYVEYATNFISSNFATATVASVAKNIGIHRSYLTTIFKKKMGVSPQEFMLQCRLRHACKLLSETNNPIQEIARNVGYDNPLTFSNMTSCCSVAPSSLTLVMVAFPVSVAVSTLPP